MTKDQFLQRFQSLSPIDYHQQSAHKNVQFETRNLRQAAVLIGLVERDSGLQVVLTKRAKHLKHHPGQVSFPGGKFEASDASLKHTALRETDEELGIAPDQVDIIGALPPLDTISRFSVTPYIGFVQPDYEAKIDRNEVDELFEVPASFILSGDSLKGYPVSWRGQKHTVYGAIYDSYFIWGVTAQILQALQRQLNTN